MNIVAIIPARGGSKGIPGKNIKLLAGKPLIAWAIAAAKGTPSITRTVVTTDYDDIAEIARAQGADVPFKRPTELAQDLTTTYDTLVHTLAWLKEHEGYAPDMIVLLPPTSPLVTSEDIEAGIMALRNHPELDSVRPIIESPKHPYKTFKLEGETLVPFFGKEVTGFDEPYDMPRQLFPKAYIYSGMFQIMWPKTIAVEKSLSGKKMGYVKVKESHAVNIDTIDDFDFADMVMRRRNTQQEE